jgi:hypothetical protein
VRGLPAVIHTRWATHGAKNIDNCHPFQVTPKIWLAHNGIMQVPMLAPDRSDTYNFVEYVLGPILKANPKLWGTAQLEKVIMEMAGDGNKFALLNAKGEIQIINEHAGAWIGKGIWVSNLRSIIPTKYVFTPYQSFTAPRVDSWAGNRTLPWPDSVSTSTQTMAPAPPAALPATTTAAATTNPPAPTGHATRDAVLQADEAKLSKKARKMLRKKAKKEALKPVASGQVAVERRRAEMERKRLASLKQAKSDQLYMTKLDRLRSMWDPNGRPTGRTYWPAET